MCLKRWTVSLLWNLVEYGRVPTEEDVNDVWSQDQVG